MRAAWGKSSKPPELVNLAKLELVVMRGWRDFGLASCQMTHLVAVGEGRVSQICSS